ncbi:MAG: hypothetical protein CM15mP111_4070 [Hyphomicrobiales bacterium]|nr:MAG: hypothetical protein CM15mP111_4070 [Hyphomicrobiales bacterium]
MTLFPFRERLDPAPTKKRYPISWYLSWGNFGFSIGGAIKIKDHVEIGYHPIRPTAFGGKKIFDWKPFFHQWHP